MAIKLAAQILRRAEADRPGHDQGPDERPRGAVYLATPTVITKANVALPVTDGYVTAASVCPTAGW